ncbi:hypothetical protein NDU88_000336 [Pleurodeles waltl]|uniref:Uncharacterized protein n=1 Tax=Pleurodeles waltl TaxID=8319 RepID=A0AAV7UST5_PLEWA|nr:hypothetical protein NDU88_000336 [Pleurodeles waltl]
MSPTQPVKTQPWGANVHPPPWQEAQGLLLRPHGGAEHQHSPARLLRPSTFGCQPPRGLQGEKPGDVAYGCASTKPCGTAQKPRGRQKTEESRKEAAAPPLQPQEHPYARPLPHKATGAGARPYATPAGRAALTTSAGGPPCLRPPPQPAAPPESGAANFTPGRRSRPEKCRRIAPAQWSITKWRPFAGQPSHAPLELILMKSANVLVDFFGL